MADFEKINDRADKFYDNENHKKAAQLFKQTADAGDPYGQYSYGFMLYNGEGVAQDQTQGLCLIAAAAEAENDNAIEWLEENAGLVQSNIGDDFYDLDEYEQAFEAYEKAAKSSTAGQIFKYL